MFGCTSLSRTDPAGNNVQRLFRLSLLQVSDILDIQSRNVALVPGPASNFCVEHP